MSRAMKIKQVIREVLDADDCKPTENQQIVKILHCPGRSLHEVENSDGEKFLVSLPTKFRKSFWLKRGDFVLVQTIEEGNKVKAEVVKILGKAQIKELKSEGLWPSAFASIQDSESAEKNLDDEGIFVNRNRHYSESSDDNNEEEDSSTDDE